MTMTVMDDPVSHGHAFVVGDLWRGPSHLLQAHKQHDSLFEALDITSTRLELPAPEEAPHFDFDTDLPALPDLDVIADSNIDSDPQEDHLLSTTPDDHDLEVWNLDLASLELPGTSPLCTWEAFDGKAVADSLRTAFLSEAGQLAFDALDSANNKEGVLPQDYTLRALRSLAHGRSSTLFQWNDDVRSFQSVLPRVSISGISQMCTESLVKDMIEVGTSIVRLREFGDVAYSSRNACSAAVAMRNSIVSVLDSIDEILCREVGGVRSLLQLQQLVLRPRQLLAVLMTLVESVRDCRTDESLISALSDRTHTLATTHHEYSAVLQALLARVSIPWLERLCMDLGLYNTTPGLANASPSAEDLDGINKEKYSFLDDADIDLIRETKMAVSLLRVLDPTHPLLGGTPSDIAPVLESSTDPNAHRQHTSELVRSYEAQMVRQIADRNTSKQLIRVNGSAKLETDETRSGEVSQENYIAELEDLMSRDIDEQIQPVPDELHSLVGTLCRHDSLDEGDCNPELSMCMSPTPLERIRPFVSLQSRLVNGILLRHIVRDHNLREQLEKQKRFQLLGSGDFVTRLSTALFSLDVQSAERKRGVIPTGEVMGLRLGSSPEQRWPPASSELRLTLAGVLEESQGATKATTSQNRGDQLGALSFAIRELPEEEIERVLDVQSVHALDFLRLQYIPASPVDAILTPEAIQQYDVVFRFLLKLLRQVYVVKSLPRRKSGGHGDASNEKMITFANQSHHFVSVQMAHAMELGINAPWRALMISIGELEQTLHDEDRAGEIGTKATVGIQGLRQLHEACLDRIRGRLLLKRKHTKLRLAIEEVFAAILQTAAVISSNGTMTDESAFEERYISFRRACSELCGTLRQVVEKPPKVMSAAEGEDAESIRMLLMKLDWNEFYSATG